MNGELMRKIKEAIREEHLIKLIDIEKIDVENERVIPTLEQIQSFARSIGVSEGCFYYVNKELPTFCFYDFPVFVSFDAWEEEVFNILRIKERVLHLKSIAEISFEKENFDDLFFFTEDSVKIMLFNKLYWLLPDEVKYQKYMDIYINMDYGHELIDRKIINDVWNHQPISEKTKIKKELDCVNQENQITIYRGEGALSTPNYLAMSWTTSLNVACYFATRIRSDLTGRIYKAKIKKDLVLNYENSRKEQEVIINPTQLKDVKEIRMAGLNDELELLQSEGYLDEYYIYKNTFIKEKHYRNPGGIHGVEHVKRVLFHSISMSRVLGLSDAERAILANASIYHDIGRKHDDSCTMHGEWSWIKFIQIQSKRKYSLLMSINCVIKRRMGEKEGYELKVLNRDEENIVRFLVEYHCRDDRDGKLALDNMHLGSQMKELYWRLYLIFKDCDGLDRVRLSVDELDVEYFRTTEAKERLLLAHQLKNASHQL
ncbi:HD domain-containing protein (plasmid) [Paenibacillus thiaminolyticus]|uniref:HD domain-containing protein n=1 Tax=Paenibacillus thiaminolyticus TaxID=49283 RepID=UPI00232C0790|nr:HD domain-containing protein [Paenibacillus thiaminolyticus]WCF11429.1 HD domain-containing protein [Paenibacillus thiaminolyticus]